MHNKMDAIKDAISDKKTLVVSFDVFDTLLVRPFWFPTDLFYFLDREASKLLGTVDIVNFSACRREAEQRARLEAGKAGKEEVTLREIYSCIKETKLFSNEIIDSLMEKEVELEIRFCRARKSAVELLKYATSQGKQIIAISDMYLPGDVIEKLLRINGIDGFEHIFVSCEEGVSKATGKLFKNAAKSLGIELSAIVHIGDNLKTDVKVPSRLGIRAFPYYRTVNLLAGEIPGAQCGVAFKQAYIQQKSPFPAFYALKFLGLRCMLAVAANQVYDDPFRACGIKGHYADDPELFGNLALGMYCMAHALWVNRIAQEKNCNRAIFFSRDGYLIYRAFERLQQNISTPIESVYARISRKALLPLLLSDDIWLLCAGSHLVYNMHSPKSICRLMSSVLIDEANDTLKGILGAEWDKQFSGETELLRFLSLLRNQYIDHKKMLVAVSGFRAYYANIIEGNVLTYDVGYSLRSEIVLKTMFPKSSITACFTHMNDDISSRRSSNGDISIRTFYPFTPYVSWLPRELFLTEPHASCSGFTDIGEPLFSSQVDVSELVDKAQKYALSFIEAFISAFREDASWLPLQFSDACLPFESFLHVPSMQEKRWVEGMNSDNDAGNGIRLTDVCQLWRTFRTDYWISQHHFGKLERHVVRFLMLIIYDKKELKALIQKRFPSR